MSQNGKMAMTAITVLVPADAHGIQFAIRGRWFDERGVMCPPQDLAYQEMDPAGALALVMQMASEGLIGATTAPPAPPEPSRILRLS